MLSGWSDGTFRVARRPFSVSENHGSAHAKNARFGRSDSPPTSSQKPNADCDGRRGLREGPNPDWQSSASVWWDWMSDVYSCS